MNLFRTAMKREQKRILRLVDLTEVSEQQEGMGSLHLERHGRNLYGYEQWYEHGKRVEKKYLGTINSAPVKRHVDMRLRNERLRRLETNKKLLTRMEGKFLDYEREAILRDLPKSYSIASSNDSFNQRYEEIRQWANGDWERNQAPFSKAATYAKDGTRVRSKGECIYHNMLLEHGLLFVYDCYMEFTNKNGDTKWLCPDFVIQCMNGELIIIEHLGLLHDKGYAIDFGEKCHWYIQHGFILGKNFFVTSDDMYGGTDSQALLEVVEKVESLFFGY